jgi:hypothetical protein
MLQKLLDPRIWKRIYIERLGEPLIYNLVACFVALFGNITKKIDYDLVPRQPYAFGLHKAFELLAAERGRIPQSRLVLIEFGVASGAGLLNICKISESLSKHYKIDYLVVGFDTGSGMPPPVDYRDHPEKYLDGDFEPHDTEKLLRSLPPNASIKYGPIAETVGALASSLTERDVIGFVSIDVDYWSSAKDCMKLFDDSRLNFLPRMPMYLDDVNNIDHHPFAGELLAVSEFNIDHEDAKISKMNQLRNWRVFKNALWLDQMYWYLDLKHPYFTRDYHAQRARTKLSNPYLGMKQESHFRP